jgi:hypothetical protein
VSAPAVFGVNRAGQDDNRNLREFGAGLKPCEDIETAVFGHFEIQKYK